jgi:hypothetical protein
VAIEGRDNPIGGLGLRPPALVVVHASRLLLEKCYQDNVRGGRFLGRNRIHWSAPTERPRHALDPQACSPSLPAWLPATILAHS